MGHKIELDVGVEGTYDEVLAKMRQDLKKAPPRQAAIIRYRIAAAEAFQELLTNSEAGLTLGDLANGIYAVLGATLAALVTVAPAEARQTLIEAMMGDLEQVSIQALRLGMESPDPIDLPEWMQ